MYTGAKTGVPLTDEVLEEEGPVRVRAGLQIHQLAVVEAETSAQVRLDAHDAKRATRPSTLLDAQL